MRAFGADDGTSNRTPTAWMILPAPPHPTKEHAFGVDDDPLYHDSVPSPAFGLGQFKQALLGHSCQAPKNSFTSAAAVVKRTRRFCRHAATQRPVKRWVLPVPHSPISKTGSARSI